MFSLDKKYVIVTGAASGIGLAIAEVFASAGAQVALVDLDLARVRNAASEITARENRASVGYGCDVSSVESVRTTFDDIFRANGGQVNVLVNCAGIAHVGSLSTTSVEDMDRLYAVNVRGTYLTMRAVLAPMLQANRGVILNMASIAATSGLADRFAYSMTKGAVLAMTLSTAKDFIGQGIRCNCISPARVHTPFVDGFVARNYPGQEAEKMKQLASSQPIGRMGTPEEVAQLALYLCSDEASFVTGVDYPIDGGFLNLR